MPAKTRSTAKAGRTSKVFRSSPPEPLPRPPSTQTALGSVPRPKWYEKRKRGASPEAEAGRSAKPPRTTSSPTPDPPPGSSPPEPLRRPVPSIQRPVWHSKKKRSASPQAEGGRSTKVRGISPREPQRNPSISAQKDPSTVGRISPVPENTGEQPTSKPYTAVSPHMTSSRGELRSPIRDHTSPHPEVRALTSPVEPQKKSTSIKGPSSSPPAVHPEPEPPSPEAPKFFSASRELERDLRDEWYLDIRQHEVDQRDLEGVLRGRELKKKDREMDLKEMELELREREVDAKDRELDLREREIGLQERDMAFRHRTHYFEREHAERDAAIDAAAGAAANAAANAAMHG